MNAFSLDLQLHLERSHCINAFVNIEKAIFALASKLCPGNDNELLSQKIKRIRDVAASSNYSKEQRKLLHAALDDLEMLSSIRNDIVHGALTVLSDGTIPLAAFVNARQVDCLAPTARLLTNQQLQQITILGQKLADRLNKVLVRPTRQSVD